MPLAPLRWPDGRVCSYLLDKFGKKIPERPCDNLREVVQGLEARKCHVGPKTVAVMVKLLCRWKKPYEALWQLKKLKRRGFPVNKNAHDSILHGFASVGNEEVFTSLWAVMLHDGFLPGPEAFEAAILLYKNTGHKAKITSVLDEMQSHDPPIPLTESARRYLIASCTDLQEALSLEVNTWTQGEAEELLKLCTCKEQTETVLAGMAHHQLDVCSLYVCEALCQACVNRGDFDSFWECIHKTQHRSEYLNFLILTACIALPKHNAKSLSLAEAAFASTADPKIRTYTALIMYYLKHKSRRTIARAAVLVKYAESKNVRLPAELKERVVLAGI